MDMGISEFDFWNYTIAELERAIKSKQRIRKREAQEKANFDYILADLIGRSFARVYSSGKIPDISEVYPTLFDKTEVDDIRAKRQDELSALRFRQFANNFNKHFEEVPKKVE